MACSSVAAQVSTTAAAVMRSQDAIGRARQSEDGVLGAVELDAEAQCPTQSARVIRQPADLRGPDPVPLQVGDVRHAEPGPAGGVRDRYARALTQGLLYDEALAVFAKIDPAKVVDPATCLFYRAV